MDVDEAPAVVPAAPARAPFVATAFDDDEDSDAEGVKEPKMRWAVFFGYIGSRFQGLQK
jgi:hypothetical protein